MDDYTHIIIGLQTINLIHTLLLKPRLEELGKTKTGQPLQFFKPIDDSDLLTVKVSKWMSVKEDLDRLPKHLQFPLNQLKKLLNTSEVIGAIHPAACGNCDTQLAVGNHLHLVVKNTENFTALRQLSRSFKRLGGFCYAADVGCDETLLEIFGYMKNTQMIFIGANSNIFLDKWNKVSPGCGLSYRDKIILPPQDVLDAATLGECEEREEEIRKCGVLPIDIQNPGPSTNALSKDSISLKRGILSDAASSTKKTTKLKKPTIKTAKLKKPTITEEFEEDCEADTQPLY